MAEKFPAAKLLSNVQVPTDVTLDERGMCDLEMLIMGAFAPLNGYLNFRDFCSVVETARLCDGTLWPIPISLPIQKTEVIPTENLELKNIQVIRLRDIVGTILAEVAVEDCYEPNVDVVSNGVLGTMDDNHPYVQYLHAENAIYVGGRIRCVHPILHFDFVDLRRTPEQVKRMIQEVGWKVVVGFQTRNPLHRSHFELTRQALQDITESTKQPAHLLLTPACGPTQSGDVKYHVRVRCYKKILPAYREHTGKPACLVLLPLAMRMAGPREALWHALIRKNYGCTHFIVGRDHAGPSTRRTDGTPFYGPYEAHEYLKSVVSELGIIPVFGKNLLYLGAELGYVQEDKVPKGASAFQMSGTKFREMLEERKPIPDWFSFPEIVKELQLYYKPRAEQGFCLYFTGLPCSGKSTLASAVEAALLEREGESRQVTLFDADIIRTHLSRGLGYDRTDRQINVRRIGYVASLVVQHHGICIVANIAPYTEDRTANRELINSAGGGYVEVYVSTPLEVCEERDVKHLYRKARLGQIKQFTGVSDPYEVPSEPELVVDSSEDIVGKVNVVMNYLRTNCWII